MGVNNKLVIAAEAKTFYFDLPRYAGNTLEA